MHLVILKSVKSESPIQSEETPISHNRDVISTTEVSLPVMPDDLSSIGETHVQHNETTQVLACIQLYVPGILIG